MLKLVHLYNISNSSYLQNLFHLLHIASLLGSPCFKDAGTNSKQLGDLTELAQLMSDTVIPQIPPVPNNHTLLSQTSIPSSENNTTRHTCLVRIKDQVGNAFEILRAPYAYKVLFLIMAQFILL